MSVCEPVLTSCEEEQGNTEDKQGFLSEEGSRPEGGLEGNTPTCKMTEEKYEICLRSKTVRSSINNQERDQKTHEIISKVKIFLIVLIA